MKLVEYFLSFNCKFSFIISLFERKKKKIKKRVNYLFQLQQRQQTENQHKLDKIKEINF
jgi:hypothetical protein